MLLFLACIALLLINSVRADTLTQFNDSSIIRNFTAPASGPQNFTVYLGVPANSSISSVAFGSVSGQQYDVLVSKDAYVLNITSFKDAVRGDETLKVTHSDDEAARRSYVAFTNVTVDPSKYGSIMLSLPFDSPGVTTERASGHYNVTVHAVYNPAIWSESTLTWNNQPCGKGMSPDNATNCNLTPIAKTEVSLSSSITYSCTNDRVLVNVTDYVREHGNVSFLIRDDAPTGFEGINAFNPCSKETGPAVPRNGSYPTVPALIFDGPLFPRNVTFFINSSIAHANVSILNSSISYNMSLNASLAQTYSGNLFTPIPIVVQVIGPGILQVGSLAINYQPKGLYASLSFSNTSTYSVTYASGPASFIKEFRIVNNGTEPVYNCTFETAVVSGSSLQSFMEQPINLTVGSNASALHNLTLRNVDVGAYENNVNVNCFGNLTNNSYSTNSPITFIFSISSPGGSAPGGGGGPSAAQINIFNVSGQKLEATPAFYDSTVPLLPLSSSYQEYAIRPTLRLKTCTVTPPFHCDLREDASLAVVSINLTANVGQSQFFETEALLVAVDDQVLSVPVRVRAPIVSGGFIAGIVAFFSIVAFIVYLRTR